MTTTIRIRTFPLQHRAESMLDHNRKLLIQQSSAQMAQSISMAAVAIAIVTAAQ